MKSVIDEIARLTAAGVGEITLIGQNVNAYRGRDANGEASDLAALLAAAAEIPGVLRLRYATSHPNDMSDSLIAAHRDNPALAPYLHLPIQAGADRILAAMNRKHRVRDYLDIVARVRRARPDIALSSDFIVGFPGETDAEFRQTLAVVREVGFASGLRVQIFAAARHAGRRPRRPDRRSGQGGAARRALRPDRRAAGRLQPRPSSAAGSTCCSTGRDGAPVKSSAARPICNRCAPRATRAGSAPWRASKSSASAPNTLIGRIVAPASYPEAQIA